MSNKNVTIVIATRNRARELNKTLEILQFYHSGTPIIVVDNASTDDTCVLVKRRQAHYALISLIRLQRNFGAVAPNVGVNAAKTPFVAFNDDDSYWAPDALKQAVKIFSAYPSLGGIAGRILIGYEAKEDPMNGLLDQSPISSEEILPGPPVFGFLTCGCMVCVKAFVQVGGFDRVLHFRGEEKLLAIDLAAAGWPICYINSLVVHHYPSLNRSVNFSAQVREQRNDLLTTWLRRPFKICFRETYSLLKKSPYNKIVRKALIQVILKLPAVFLYRRSIPKRIEKELQKLENNSV